MNTDFGVAQVSLRFVTETSDHSVSNHPSSSRLVSGVLLAGLTGPQDCGRPLGAVRHLGFAFPQQARHDDWPNRVHWYYGLIVHLRLLSTPPHGDAVTIGYGTPERPGKDSHLAISTQLQAHWGGPPCPPCEAPLSAQRSVG